MIIGISGKAQSGKDTVAKMIYLWYYNQRKAIVGSTPIVDAQMKLMLDAAEGYSQNIITLRFADRVKDIVAMLIGCTRAQLEDNLFKETPLGEEWWYYKSGTTLTPYDSKHPIGILIKPTPRMLLQQVGTECGRNILHPNVWVNALGSILKVSSSNLNVIIPDVRFLNEFNYLSKRKAVLIRVQSNNQLIMNHPSETELDDVTFDYVIINNGYLWDLWLKVSKIMENESQVH